MNIVNMKTEIDLYVNCGKATTRSTTTSSIVDINTSEPFYDMGIYLLTVSHKFASEKFHSEDEYDGPVVVSDTIIRAYNPPDSEDCSFVCDAMCQVRVLTWVSA